MPRLRFGLCLRLVRRNFYTILINVLFFCSSIRRHTRWQRDWSSDVCSSDLEFIVGQVAVEHVQLALGFHGVTVDGVLDLDRRIGVEMPEATAQKRRGAGLPEQPVEAFGAPVNVLRHKAAELFGQIQKNGTGFKVAPVWLDALVQHGRNLGVRVDIHKARAELLAFAYPDQPGIVLGLLVAGFQQLLEHDGDLDPVGRAQRIELMRMLANGQGLVVGGAGNGPVDAGKLAAVGVFFPYPYFGRFVAAVVHAGRSFNVSNGEDQHEYMRSGVAAIKYDAAQKLFGGLYLPA